MMRRSKGMELNLENALAAASKHKTVFFDAELNPVMPQEGQWFCEFDEYDGQLRDEALVEYLGISTKAVLVNGTLEEYQTHAVITEHAESDREPSGIVLIRQS